MRLIQVMASASRGGAEAFFTRLALGLAEAGIDQQLVVCRGAASLEPLRAGGLGAVELPFWANFAPPTRWTLSRVIKAYRPDIVLTWMSRATRLCPRGQFVHVGRLGGYYDLKYYAACDHLIGNTRDIVEYCRRGGWPTERTCYLPNFADEASASAVPRTALGTPQGVPVLLALGRLHRDKAFDVLLLALVHLPSVHVWLAGEGPERAALQALAVELGVASRVAFLGWRTDTAALLEAADCLICPSRVEPLGNVILEAWAHHKPVVAAAATGPAGLLDHGRTGLLVPPEDPAALASAIRAVLGEKALAETLAANGHAAYARDFSRQAVIGRYIEYFSSVSRPCAA